MPITAASLHGLATRYLADEQFQGTRPRLTAARDASLPALQMVTQRFIRGETDMQQFRIELEKALHVSEDWGATGTGFMMELHKFGKHHLAAGPAPEQFFRHILTGLHAENLGQRIEQFYTFLLDERKRLRQEGKTSHMIVAASNSAFIVSLFAFWLNPDDDVIIYYKSVRDGLLMLMKNGYLLTPSDIHVSNSGFEVHTASEHRACMEAVTYLLKNEAQLKQNRYWFEYFCYWLTQRKQAQSSADMIIKDDDSLGNMLANLPKKQTSLREVNAPYSEQSTPDTPPVEISSMTPEHEAETDAPRAPGSILVIEQPAPAETTLIANEPLRPTPEPLLKRLIHDIQRHILLDETVIRRLYHALLSGHVILTGPPGTGKTELARLLPEILWQSELPNSEGQEDESALSSATAYTTRLVTATDDWSVRTLISGIAPQSNNGGVTYKVQYGHLTNAILKNWHFQGERPEDWSMMTLRRTCVTAPSSIERGTLRTFRGQWLVIDEFNRAPIDLALGDALTALGGSDTLRVAIEGGSAELPIPQDFRIIGTLNSFDRSYLNQISEALKRRFSFIEILSPSRAMRADEQKIVLDKALRKVSHLSNNIDAQENTVYWLDTVEISYDPEERFTLQWESDEAQSFRPAFEAAWSIFEVIRIYRQLGTAQAISLFKQILIPGLLQNYSTTASWLSALDAALCDTIADQLQVLLPDEIETLLLFLNSERANFHAAYQQLLTRLTNIPQRLYGQLLALSSVSDEREQPHLSDADIERIVEQSAPAIDTAILSAIFHLEQPRYPLPQFTRRLHTFKAERGL